MHVGLPIALQPDADTNAGLRLSITNRTLMSPVTPVKKIARQCGSTGFPHLLSESVPGRLRRTARQREPLKTESALQFLPRLQSPERSMDHGGASLPFAPPTHQRFIDFRIFPDPIFSTPRTGTSARTSTRATPPLRTAAGSSRTAPWSGRRNWLKCRDRSRRAPGSGLPAFRASVAACPRH